MEEGTLPESMLAATLKYSEPKMVGIFSGMLPSKKFSASRNNVREEIFPREHGMTPMKLLKKELSEL